MTGVSWEPSERKPPRTKRARLLLEVLIDGEPHSRAEVFRRVGYMLTNNAASELREAGYNIAQHRRRIDGRNVFFYRLLDLPEREPEVFACHPPSGGGTNGGSRSESSGGADAAGAGPSEPGRRPSSTDEQLTLLEAA